MNKPTPIHGSSTIIKQQSMTIREQYRTIKHLQDDNAKLVNVIARALNNMTRHACITDDTLRVMQQVHKQAMETER